MTNFTHAQFKKAALRKKSVRKEYDSLKEEFELFEVMVKARLKAGKTQEDVAKKMKTTTSVIGRLETGGGRHRHSPTIETLRNYARAVGCDLNIRFIYAKK